ncbi:MAG: FecR domain-containing protein, partial [Candidatus Acidiferrum sp.]
MNDSFKNQPEHSDYLWDPATEPDPEIQRLEHALQEFRLTQTVPPVFPRLEPAIQPSSWWTAIMSRLWVPRLAAVAAVAAAVVFAVSLSFRDTRPAHLAIGWDVELTATKPSGSAASKVSTKKSQLHVGETFETDRASTATIAVADIGRLELEPLTRLRLLQSAEGRKQVALDRGTIRATIWAPPGEFVLDTPSATAVDLGCMYTLKIDDSGGGLLRTTLGWVGFQSNGRESFIPAGAASVIQPRYGPGTPYFEDASDSFRSALADFDSGGESPAQRTAALQIILREPRSRDGLTLWHLLSRTSESDRPAVYD